MSELTNVLVHGEISLLEQISSLCIEYTIFDEANGCELLRFLINNHDDNTSNTLIQLFETINKAASSVHMEKIKEDFFNNNQIQFELPDNPHCLDICVISGEFKVLENIISLYNSASMLGIA